MSSGFFGGIVEDGEARSHEQPCEVILHFEVFAEFVPSCAVGAVTQAGDILPGVEVGINAEIDDVAMS